jgi:hypothetical protein
MTSYETRLRVIQRARQNPAFRKSLRRKALKKFASNVVKVPLLVLSYLALIAPIVGFFAVITCWLVLYVCYKSVLLAVSDVFKVVRRGSR